MEQTSVVINEVARLADAELIAGLQRWVRADRSVTARLLMHLEHRTGWSSNDFLRLSRSARLTSSERTLRNTGSIARSVPPGALAQSAKSSELIRVPTRSVL